MKHIFYLLIVIALLNTGCRREGDDNTKQVHERLHGKYLPVSMTTSQPLDINGDGAASADMLSEFDYPGTCHFEIRIVDKKTFLIQLFWPEQYIETGNNTPVVHYACQSPLRSFTIAPDNNTLLVKRDDVPNPDPNLWVFPDSVTIEGNGLIKVVITKKVYTPGGWQSVKITTVYERFTMIT